MPLHETDYEAKLLKDRQDALDKIVAIARELNPELSDLAARFPNAFRSTHTIPALRALAVDGTSEPVSGEALEATPIEAAIAGRVVAIRGSFAVLQQAGERLQIWVHKDNVGEPLFRLYKLLHLGDHIGVTGALMRTRTGELTLKVRNLDASLFASPEDAPLQPLTLLSKALLALPDKYAGLEDIETRYRRRYVDLIMNSEGGPANADSDAATNPASTNNELNVRETFVKRAAILRAIRTFFDSRGYLEVETPMLQPVAGGATARPFTTHHNALDMPLYLRIAPELYLKRLVVGGLDRVYEINRNFRNEGVSTQHNPEFTMLEFYQAYANYHDLMDLTQELITFVAKEVNGTTIARFPLPKGPRAGEVVEIDLAKWQKLSMREAIVKFWPKSLKNAPSADTLRSPGALRDFAVSAELELTNDLIDMGIAQLDGVDLSDLREAIYDFEAGHNNGRTIAELFEFLAEPHLIQPTIICDFPLAVSPLSKVKPGEPDWTERFEFYIGGFEVGNAFSELNDALDQEARFEDQLRQKAAGDDEAMAEMDSDYVRALGYGLPPTAGEGIGIDRLTMILTGSRSIRDVILFPLMRPEKKTNLEKDAEGDTAHGESAE